MQHMCWTGYGQELEREQGLAVKPLWNIGHDGDVGTTRIQILQRSIQYRLNKLDVSVWTVLPKLVETFQQ